MIKFISLVYPVAYTNTFCKSVDMSLTVSCNDPAKMRKQGRGWGYPAYTLQPHIYDGSSVN